MAGKKTKPQFVATPIGTLVYPKLTEPDEYQGKKDFKTGILIDMSTTEGKNFKKLVDTANDTAYDEKVEWLNGKISSEKGQAKEKAETALRDLKKHTPYENEYDEDGEPTGNLVFHAKLNYEGKNLKTGKTWFNRVNFIDSVGAPIKSANLQVWGGTTARLSVQVNPFFVAASNLVGASLRLSAVQIIQLVSGGNGYSAEQYGFSNEDGGFSADDLPEEVATPKAEDNDDSDEEDIPTDGDF